VEFEIVIVKVLGSSMNFLEHQGWMERILANCGKWLAKSSLRSLVRFSESERACVLCDS